MKWRKSALRLARLYQRIRNIQRDFLHQLTTHLAKTKLKVSGLVQNQKLARHIADVGWGEFRRMLAYKRVWYGSQLIVADQYFPSSKTCSACGHVLEVLALEEREWVCPACSAHQDRDVNAAKNLLLAGLRPATGSSPGRGACLSAPRASRQAGGHRRAGG